MQLARRSLGLTYGPMPFNEFFCELCELLFSYRYVRYDTKPSETLKNWLYEHSGGVMALLVALVHDAQEIAIMSGTERLDLQTLEEAYKQRLTMMHDFITLTKLPLTWLISPSRPANAGHRPRITCCFSFRPTGCSITRLMSFPAEALPLARPAAKRLA